MLNTIPAKWAMARFDEIAEVITGSTPSTKISEYYDGPIPFVSPADLDQGVPIHRAKTTLSKLGAQQARLIPKGSVLVCCIGATIGKVGIAGTEVATNQQINALVFNPDKVDSNYGYYYCQTLKHIIRHNGTSTTLPILNKSRFSQLEIPLPPLSEQKRIADILDKADAIRRKRRELGKRLATLENSLFNEAFILTAQKTCAWPTVLLDDVLFFQEGPGVRNWQFTDSGVKLLNVRNLVDGQLQLDNTERFLSEDEAFGKYNHFLALPGDLVMATSGVTWGKTAWVDKSDLPLCMNTSTVRFRPLDTGRITRTYMHAFLKSHSFTRQIDRLVTGSAQPNFGPSHLKKIKIVIPDLESQARYERRMNRLIAMKKVNNEALRTANDLFNSLVQRAFKGEL